MLAEQLLLLNDAVYHGYNKNEGPHCSNFVAFDNKQFPISLCKVRRCTTINCKNDLDQNRN